MPSRILLKLSYEKRIFVYDGEFGWLLRGA